MYLPKDKHKQKLCQCCDLVKPWTEFYMNSSTKRPLAKCIPCDNARRSKQLSIKRGERPVLVDQKFNKTVDIAKQAYLLGLSVREYKFRLTNQ